MQYSSPSCHAFHVGEPQPAASSQHSQHQGGFDLLKATAVQGGMMGGNTGGSFPAGNETVAQMPLDSLLMEGDDHTWNMSDWNWDPYHMFAEPKNTSACQGCNALKRRKGPSSNPIPVNHTQPECSHAQPQPPPTQHHNPQADAIAVALQLLRASGVNLSKSLTPESLLGQQLSQHVPAAQDNTSNNDNSPGLSNSNLSTLLDAMVSNGDGSHLSPHDAGPSNHHHGLSPSSYASGAPTTSSCPATAGLLASGTSVDKPTSVFAQFLPQVMDAVKSGTTSGQERGTTETAAGDVAPAMQVPVPPLSPFSLPSSNSALNPHELTPPAPTLSGNTEEVMAPSPTTAPQQEGSAKGDEPESDTSAMQGPAAVQEAEVPEVKLYCQVPGCAKDLSSLKDYHQRYRICDVHIKLPQVHKDGRLQRFCQQCGRFHDLGAFDGARKSCRDQLMKHNARRRRRNGPATPAPLPTPPSSTAHNTNHISNHPAQHTLLNTGHTYSSAGAAAAAAAQNQHTLLHAGHTAPSAAAQHTSVMMSGHSMMGGPAGGIHDMGGGCCSGGHGQDQSQMVPPPNPGLLNAAQSLSSSQSLNSILGLGQGQAGQVEAPDVTKLLQALMSNPVQLHAFRVLLGVQTHPALPPQQPYPAEHLERLGYGAGVLRPPSVDPPSYQIASDIVSKSGAYGSNYSNAQTVVRLSVKIFNCTPADLPHDMKHVLLSWLDSVPKGIEGYIRPGCVLLTFHIPMDRADAEAAQSEGLNTLLASMTDPAQSDFWRRTTQIVQLFDDMAVVSQGQVMERLSMLPALQAAMQMPVVTSVAPCCVQGGGAGERVRVDGERLRGEGCELVVRSEGRTLVVQRLVEKTGPVEFTLNEDVAGAALVYVEVARGAYLSKALPVLVLQEKGMVEEVSRLTSYNLPSESIEAVLADLAKVLKGHAPGTSTGRTSLSTEERVLTAQRLLCFACDHGWVNTAKQLMDIVQEPFADFADAVSSTHKSGPQDGLTLLHRAVRSGSLEMVSSLMEWGFEGGYEWEVDCGGPNGLSPLHISTLVDDEGRISLLLLDHSFPYALTSAKTVDDVTPFHLGFQMGHYSVDRLLTVMCVHEEVKKEVKEEEETRDSEVSECRVEDNCCGSGTAVACSMRTKAVEPCVVCASTLPPLLLSIFGQCKDCGCRRPCLLDDSHHKGSCVRSQSSWSSRHYRAIKQYINSQCSCKHTHGIQYSIKALCPTCHVDRTMEVACV